MIYFAYILLVCMYIYIYSCIFICACILYTYIYTFAFIWFYMYISNYIVTSYLFLFISIIYICTVFMQYSHGKLYYTQFNIAYIFIYVWLSMYYVCIYIFIHMQISLYITHPQWSFEGLDIIDMLEKHHHSELPPRNSPQVWLSPVGDGGGDGSRKGGNVWNLILLHHKQHWIPSNFSVFLVHWNSITWFQGEMCLRNADPVLRCTKWPKAKGEELSPSTVQWIVSGTFFIFRTCLNDG